MDWLPVPDFSREVGESYLTIWRMIVAGKLEARREGRRSWSVAASEVARLRAQRALGRAASL